MRTQLQTLDRAFRRVAQLRVRMLRDSTNHSCSGSGSVLLARAITRLYQRHCLYELASDMVQFPRTRFAPRPLLPCSCSTDKTPLSQNLHHKNDRVRCAYTVSTWPENSPFYTDARSSRLVCAHAWTRLKVEQMPLAYLCSSLRFMVSIVRSRII